MYRRTGVQSLQLNTSSYQPNNQMNKDEWYSQKLMKESKKEVNGKMIRANSSNTHSTRGNDNTTNCTHNSNTRRQHNQRRSAGQQRQSSPAPARRQQSQSPSQHREGRSTNRTSTSSSSPPQRRRRETSVDDDRASSSESKANGTREQQNDGSTLSSSPSTSSLTSPSSSSGSKKRRGTMSNQHLIDAATQLHQKHHLEATRQKIRDTLRNTIESVWAKDDAGTPSTATPDTLATEIENELFAKHSNRSDGNSAVSASASGDTDKDITVTLSSTYRTSARDLAQNLKQNHTIMERLRLNEMNGSDLVNMSTSELASDALKEHRSKLQDISMNKRMIDSAAMLAQRDDDVVCPNCKNRGVNYFTTNTALTNKADTWGSKDLDATVHYTCITCNHKWTKLLV